MSLIDVVHYFIAKYHTFVILFGHFLVNKLCVKLYFTLESSCVLQTPITAIGHFHQRKNHFFERMLQILHNCNSIVIGTTKPSKRRALSLRASYHQRRAHRRRSGQLAALGGGEVGGVVHTNVERQQIERDACAQTAK